MDMTDERRVELEVEIEAFMARYNAAFTSGTRDDLEALVHLPAMYHRSEEGWPALAIHEGMIDVSDVNAAPFGVPFNPDLSDGYHQIAGVG